MTATQKAAGYPFHQRVSAIDRPVVCAEVKSNYRLRLLTRMREALRSRHYGRRTFSGRRLFLVFTVREDRGRVISAHDLRRRPDKRFNPAVARSAPAG